ncbi:MAG: hypothetical protein E7652_02325 [Ruminococcaceae bacterium]|nr:hypothetical protein [Oscillospiraceae bacterium]
MRQNKNKSVVEDLVPELEVRPLAEVNEYYIDISNKFKTAKYSMLIILVVFVLSMISIFRSDITIENFKYLARAFSTETMGYSEGYADIFYDTAGVVDLEVFNSSIVTVKTDEVSFYDMNGNNTENLEIDQISPTVVTQGKYMLVYDMNGYSFALFNNFSKLASETYEYPISCAAVSEEGMYAVVTKSRNYQSIIYLYDHNYNLVTKIYRDKYISDVKIDEDGDKVLFTSFYAKDGKYISQTETYTPYTKDEKKATATHISENSIAVTCDFFGNGGYSVLTNHSLIFFDKKDELISEFYLGNIVPNKCFILEDKVVLAYNKNIIGSQTEMKVFSDKGKELFTLELEDKILDSAYNGNDLYLLLDTNKMVKIDLTNKKSPIFTEVDKGTNSIYLADEENLIAGYSNMARAYKLDEMFTQKKEENKK